MTRKEAVYTLSSNTPVLQILIMNQGLKISRKQNQRTRKNESYKGVFGKGKTKFLHAVTDDWNKLKMLPQESIRGFFSRVYAIVSKFSIKCDIVILDPQMFSRTETLAPILIAKEFKLCKRTWGEPTWKNNRMRLESMIEDVIFLTKLKI